MSGACTPVCDTCLTLSPPLHVPRCFRLSLQSEHTHNCALSRFKRRRPRWNARHRTRHAYYSGELRALIYENQHWAELRIAQLAAAFTGCPQTEACCTPARLCVITHTILVSFSEIMRQAKLQHTRWYALFSDNATNRHVKKPKRIIILSQRYTGWFRRKGEYFGRW
jgi:hypothetical protein